MPLLRLAWSVAVTSRIYAAYVQIERTPKVQEGIDKDAIIAY